MLVGNKFAPIFNTFAQRFRVQSAYVCATDWHYDCAVTHVKMTTYLSEGVKEYYESTLVIINLQVSTSFCPIAYTCFFVIAGNFSINVLILLTCQKLLVLTFGLQEVKIYCINCHGLDLVNHFEKDKYHRITLIEFGMIMV